MQNPESQSQDVFDKLKRIRELSAQIQVTFGVILELNNLLATKEHKSKPYYDLYYGPDIHFDRSRWGDYFNLYRKYNLIIKKQESKESIKESIECINLQDSVIKELIQILLALESLNANEGDSDNETVLPDYVVEMITTQYALIQATPSNSRIDVYDLNILWNGLIKILKAKLKEPNLFDKDFFLSQLVKHKTLDRLIKEYQKLYNELKQPLKCNINYSNIQKSE